MGGAKGGQSAFAVNASKKDKAKKQKSVDSQPKVDGSPKPAQEGKVKKGKKMRRHGKRIPEFEENILIEQDKLLMARAKREKEQEQQEHEQQEQEEQQLNRKKKSKKAPESTPPVASNGAAVAKKRPAEDKRAGNLSKKSRNDKKVKKNKPSQNGAQTELTEEEEVLDSVEDEDISGVAPFLVEGPTSDEWEDMDDDEEETDDSDRFEDVTEQFQSATRGAKKKAEDEHKTDKDSLMPHERGSMETARICFDWLISPIDVDEFLKNKWEKSHLHIRRSKPGYFSNIFSTKAFETILREKTVFFGKNLDVTSFSETEGRQTHNPIGQAHAPVVWDFYNNGCSLRMLNPQAFNVEVWKLCSTLQEFFGSMVGANMYLTPPGTQGFAPHFDDVEVFILQIEGKKRWRLHESRNEQEMLPRFSSPNFSQDEIGRVIFDEILEPGDLLYLPRGTIHQGNCLPDAHSLHITISAAQLNTYGDLLKTVLSTTLETAMAEDQEFRQGLPLDYGAYMGISNSDKNSVERDEFQNKIRKLIEKLYFHCPLDLGADLMVKRFLRDSLPPHLTTFEKKRSIVEDGERWDSKKRKVVNRVELAPDTELRLIRANCMRLIPADNEDEKEKDVENEEETSSASGSSNDDEEIDCENEEDNNIAIRIYYNIENSQEIHGNDEQYLVADISVVHAVEYLVQKYPLFITPEDLPGKDLERKMSIVQDLYEKKLLMTRHPLEAQDD